MKPKTIIEVFSAAGLLAAGLLLAPQHAGAATINLPPGSSIQAAINAASPGDTIRVPAGTYAEPQITIDKAVSVLGESASTTIIDGGNNGGAMTNVGLVRITATDGDVTFSGFTLQKAGHFNAVAVGLYVGSTEPHVTYLITQNKIVGSNDPNDTGDYGLLTQSGYDTLLFLENEITATGSNPILMKFHVGPVTISGNKLDVGVYGSDSIFILTTENVDITTLQKIEDNTIDVGTGGAGGTLFDAAHRATGITFAAAYGGTGNSGRFTKVQVMRNTITSIQAERRGISLWNGAGNSFGGDIPGAMVQGNTLVGVNKAPGSKGIQLLGVITGAKLINNTMRALDTGIHLRTWLGGAPLGTKIMANRFQAVTTSVSTDAEAAGTKQHGDHISP